MKPIRALLIDLEYPRYEINEPINVDTVLDSLDDHVHQNVSFDVWYRTLGDMRRREPNDYDLVLISTKVSSMDVLKKMIALFKDKPIIIGGMLATFAHEQLLSEYPYVILSMGECECNLNSILHYFIEKNDISYVKENLKTNKISGISFVDTEDNVYFSPITPHDLSSIKESLKHRALCETVQKNGLVRVEGSRGCPWNNCSFCCVDWRYGNGKWRPFPIERTVNEITNVVKGGAKSIYFTDEDFVANAGHFFSLFGEIVKLIDEKIIPQSTSFWGSTSIYTLLHFTEKEFEDFLELSSKCNVDVLFIGVESGCAEQLKRYSKGVEKKDILRILKKLSENGIYVDVGFIMFDAETNLSEVRENLTFCIESGLNKTVSRLAKPIRIIPHTKIYKHYEESNLLDGDLDSGELTYSYCFKDKKVQILFESLNHIRTQFLDRINQMQAEVRMDNKYDDGELSENLLKYRNCEFEFIEEFVAHFLEKEVERAIVDEMIKRAIERV